MSLWISPQQPNHTPTAEQREPHARAAIAQLVDEIVADVASAAQADALLEGELGKMDYSGSFQFEAAAAASEEQYPVNWPLGQVLIDETSAARARCVPACCVLRDGSCTLQCMCLSSL